MKADGPRIGLHSAALGKRNGVNAILGSRPDGGDEKEEEEEEEEAEEEGWRREGIGKIMKSVGLVRVGKRTLLERRFRLLDEVSVACMHGPSVKKKKTNRCGNSAVLSHVTILLDWNEGAHKLD